MLDYMIYILTFAVGSILGLLLRKGLIKRNIDKYL